MKTYKIDLFQKPSVIVNVSEDDEKQFEINGWVDKKQRMSAAIVVSDEVTKFFENKNDDSTNIILFKWLAKHNVISNYNSKLHNKFIELFTIQKDNI